MIIILSDLIEARGVVKANMAATASEQMTDEEILSQTSYVPTNCYFLGENLTRPCRTFILAGMDTTSNALSRILHQLSMYPDAQTKLRAELVEATNGGTIDLDYDTLMKLPYLDAVCRETLRLFAPVTFSSGRACVHSPSMPYTPSNLVALSLPVQPKISSFPSPSLCADAMESSETKLSYHAVPLSFHTSRRAM